MTFDSFNATLKLKARQIVRVSGLHGARITCREGTVWITQDGDRTDTVLERGQSFGSEKTGQVLIYGLGEAEVEIVEVEIVEAAPANAPQFATRHAARSAPGLALAA